MSGVDGAGAGDRGKGPPLALVGALHAELADALRAVAWYGGGDQGLCYAHSEVDAPDERLGEAIERRPVREEACEYAIDAYEEVVVVTLSARTIPSTSHVAGVALAVERDAPLQAVTTAIERAVAASR